MTHKIMGHPIEIQRVVVIQHNDLGFKLIRSVSEIIFPVQRNLNFANNTKLESQRVGASLTR